MRRLLYFIPGQMTIARPALERLGLGDRFAATQQRGIAAKGPSGDGGVLVAEPPQNGEELKYEPHQQRWRSCDGGRWWVGYDTTMPPGPDDLARADVAIRGYAVKLGDGQSWVIPGCNPMMATPCLPYRRVLGDDGTRQTVIVDRYAAFQQDAKAMWELFCDRQGDVNAFASRLEDDAAWDLAERAIAVQYRLSKWEIDHLGLLDNLIVGRVIMAILDIETIIEVTKARAETLKKNEPVITPDTSATAPGGRA